MSPGADISRTVPCWQCRREGIGLLRTGKGGFSWATWLGAEGPRIQGCEQRDSCAYFPVQVQCSVSHCLAVLSFIIINDIELVERSQLTSQSAF